MSTPALTCTAFASQTCHTKSVITKPQNVYVLRDIMCSGYVAGGNTNFFGAPRSGFGKMADPEEVRMAVEKRLSFQDDASGDYDSMLAFCAPYGDGAKRDQVISISERLLPWDVNQGPTARNHFPGGGSNFEAVKTVLSLDTIHFGEDVRASENMEFISQGSMNNSLCFVGPHRKYNPFSNQYHELVPGQGHFGPDAIPGDVSCCTGSNAARTHRIATLHLSHHTVFACCSLAGPLAPWRVRLAQGGPGQHGLARGGRARADVHDQAPVSGTRGRVGGGSGATRRRCNRACRRLSRESYGHCGRKGSIPTGTHKGKGERERAVMRVGVLVHRRESKWVVCRNAVLHSDLLEWVPIIESSF